MGIRYELAEDIQMKVNELSRMLFPHIKVDSVICIRSFGSSSRGTIARCHALGKAMQLALGRKGFYVIEVISRRFDRMSEVDQTKTLIHELMHIPKTFGGGFIHHNVVHVRNVERVYEHYCNLKKNSFDGYNNNNNNNNNNNPENELKFKDKVLDLDIVDINPKVTVADRKRNWWFG